MPTYRFQSFRVATKALQEQQWFLRISLCDVQDKGYRHTARTIKPSEGPLKSLFNLQSYPLLSTVAMPKFIGSTSTLLWGQMQADLHLFSTHDSSTYPKFRLVHRTVTVGLGFIYGEFQAAKDGAWIPIPCCVPADLHIEQADGTYTVLPMEHYFLRGRGRLIGWSMPWGRRYKLKMRRRQDGKPMKIHYKKHNRVEGLAPGVPDNKGKKHSGTYVAWDVQIQSSRRIG
ncbi:hypothetical protein EDD85DRAFT_957923 [Armillaria nabsnona]|nr:hypothetical protein EDD85DRAFT_957923 [Armillaria nabsnona]